MKFCSNCGHDELEFRIPDLDNLPRFCCPKCGTIFYSNPKIIAGTVSYIDNQVLLCKRAIQPRYGLWTLPAGPSREAPTSKHCPSSKHCVSSEDASCGRHGGSLVRLTKPSQSVPSNHG